MATAAHSVFAIPELFEAILTRLPHNDIVILQRVSKSFQTFLKRSVTIQQKLFLERPIHTGEDMIQVNPLMFSALRSHGSIGIAHICQPKTQEIYTYKRLIYVDSPVLSWSTDIRMRAERFIEIDVGYIRIKTSSKGHRESYVDMLAASSPLKVLIRCSDNKTRSQKGITITTIGQLARACQQLERSLQESERRVQSDRMIHLTHWKEEDFAKIH